MKAQADTYKEVRTFKYPNMTIYVHIPDLTDVERKRRMKEVEKAAVELLKSQMERKAMAQ